MVYTGYGVHFGKCTQVYGVHCTLYSEQFTLYSLHSTVCTVYTVHCAAYQQKSVPALPCQGYVTWTLCSTLLDLALYWTSANTVLQCTFLDASRGRLTSLEVQI